MKKKHYVLQRPLRQVGVLVLLMLFATPWLQAQVKVPFTQRTSSLTNPPNQQIYSIKGDYRMIGNTNLTLETYGATTPNSNHEMVYVDVDNVSTTINSSSAELTFSTENGANPNCSEVVFAGLYWTGRAHNSSSPMEFTVGLITLNKRKVKLRHNTGPYEEITANASDIWYPNGQDENMYAAYADVTDFVRTNGLGTYTVANMALREGNGSSVGYYGGWALIVVYKNSKMKWRDITIFDGYAYVEENNSGDWQEHIVDVQGYQAVQNGDVNVKIGIVAGEGDRGVGGYNGQIDALSIQRDDNTWMELSHAENTVDNFFVSSIVTEGSRNPNLYNNTGLDIVSINIDNTGNSVIGNNDTETKLKYGTNQDTYALLALAMSIDAYIPEAEALNTIAAVGGGGVTNTPEPGDIIEYTLTIKNQGTEAINDYQINIPIPYTTTYVSSSATYHSALSPTPIQPAYNATTNSIVWNIGTLPNPLTTPGIDNETILATLTYELKVTEDCFILSNPDCSPAIVVTGESSGVGATSGTDFSHIPMIYGYTENGECQGEPITVPPIIPIDATQFINDSCNAGVGYTTRHFKICDIEDVVPFDEISEGFPVGSRFWSAIDEDENGFVIPEDGATEYTVDTHFPADMGNATYYAIPPGKTKCYWEFTITVSDCVIAKDDVTQTPQGVAVKGDVLTNDDGVNITVTKATYSDLRAEINIPLGASQTIPGGDILFNSDGTYTFTPNSNYTGNVPTITYSIKDAVLKDEASATLDVTVVPEIKEEQNDTPIANNDVFVTEQAKSVTFDALVNDHDSDKDAITLTKITLVPSGGGTAQTFDVPVAGINKSVYDGVTLTGVVEINPNGNIVFNPAPNFTGEVPAIEYVLQEGSAAQTKDTALIKITVMPHRKNKVYLNDDYGVARNGAESIGIKPLDNDFDPEGDTKTLQTIQFFDASGLKIASLTSAWASDEDVYNEGVKIGTLSFDFSTKKLTFQGEPDFKGTIAMPYTIKDNADAEDKGTVYFTQLETGTNPLPIELVLFEAQLKDNNAVLTWVSAAEINNDYYTIYKSNNAETWVLLQYVNGAGNSNEELTYVEIDDQPYSGTTYYKLSQTDFDGTTEELGVRIVQLNEGNGNFTVYPNPTADFITIDGMYNDLNGLRVMSDLGADVTGSVNVTSVSSRQLKLDFGNLSNGTYFIHLDNSLIQVVKH